jgi:threonine/homoserine/homoserine lactone efflux protein
MELKKHIVSFASFAVVYIVVTSTPLKRVVLEIVTHPFIQVVANIIGFSFLLYLAKNFDRKKAEARKLDTRQQQIISGAFFGLCAGTTIAVFIVGIGKGVAQLLK